ncbi:hypothetical protein [Acidovorax sp. SDU_ACID1]|jgi:hypothetical protein
MRNNDERRQRGQGRGYGNDDEREGAQQPEPGERTAGKAAMKGAAG